MSEKHSLQSASGDPNHGPSKSEGNQPDDAAAGISTVPDVYGKYVMNFHPLNGNTS
jgi:hypothetical protein